MIYLGIDPGQTGAMAVIEPKANIADVYDWPGDEVAAARLMRQIISFGQHTWITRAVLEDVHAMPKQGVVSTFKFGTNFGIWRGILAALEIPFVLVKPQTWKKEFGLIKKDKLESLYAARRRWPEVELHLKKHHGRADALWMAEYARLKGDGE